MVVVTILAAWKIKEIDGAMLGLCHVGEALLLKLHLALVEGVELVMDFPLHLAMCTVR